MLFRLNQFTFFVSVFFYHNNINDYVIIIVLVSYNTRIIEIHMAGSEMHCILHDCFLANMNAMYEWRLLYSTKCEICRYNTDGCGGGRRVVSRR